MKKIILLLMIWILLLLTWVINLNVSQDISDQTNINASSNSQSDSKDFLSWSSIFSEDFEETTDISELFQVWKWSNFHMLSKTNTKNKESLIWCVKDIYCDTSMYNTRFEISNERSQKWENSLKFISESEGIVKSSIKKQDISFIKWETLFFSAYYFLEDSKAINDIYLFDVEVDPSNWYLYKWSPWRRIFIDSNNSLATDLWKWIKNDTKYQKNLVPFPQNQWVKLETEIFLSDNSNGYIKIWQDSNLLIDENGITLPNAKIPYSSLEVWLTANVSWVNQVLYIDNIKLYKK